MATNNSSSNGAFIAGFVLGAIGGVVATLLTTPKRGEDLRHEIESKLTQTAEPVIEKATPFVNQGKERASEIVDKAADRAQELSGKIAAMDLPFDDDTREDHASTEVSPSAGVDPKQPASS